MLMLSKHDPRTFPISIGIGILICCALTAIYWLCTPAHPDGLQIAIFIAILAFGSVLLLCNVPKEWVQPLSQKQREEV